VVSLFVDVDLYLDRMESRASDFIEPPFFSTDVAYVLMTALTDALPGRIETPRQTAGAA
jgi:FixJ family two-component response regulator